jgi:Uma2 family endonuclease
MPRREHRRHGIVDCETKETGAACMSQHALRRMSADEFLHWQLEQDSLFELVDGVPVGMVGARRAHDRVVMNAAREVGAQLRGKRCQPFSESLAVRIPAGNLRRPDLGVDCGPFDGNAMVAPEPRLVIEVLSPSTRGVDQFRKLDEYKTIESLDYILLVDPDAAEVIVWSRDAARAWHLGTVAGLEAAVELPSLGLTLRLADLYEGLTVRAAPRPVREAG